MTDVRGKAVFVSGPITDVPDAGRRFAEARSRIAALGAYSVYDPYDTWAAFGMERGWGHEQYMLVNLQELIRSEGVRRVRPFYDLMVQLPGWELSAGCREERVVADAVGIERAGYDEL